MKTKIKKRIYIDMDDVLCDYIGSHNEERTNFPDELYPQSKAGFYLQLKPLKNAVEAMAWLRGKTKFEAFILTAPSVFNPLSYTEKRLWTEKHLGFEWCSHLILSPNKSLLKGDILIDDRNTGHGQDKFEGELIQFGTDEHPDWKAVRNYLEQY